MTKIKNGHYNRQPVCRAAPELGSSLRLSFVVACRLISFKYALGRLDGSDNDHRHSPQHPHDKQVLEDRQNMMDHEIHNLVIVVLGTSGIKKTSSRLCFRRLIPAIRRRHRKLDLILQALPTRLNPRVC
jgi:hypothetical protein